MLIGDKYREYEGIWSLGKHKVVAKQELSKEEFGKILQETFKISGIDMERLVMKTE